MWLPRKELCGGLHSRLTDWEGEAQRGEGAKGWKEEPGFGSRETWA